MKRVEKILVITGIRIVREEGELQQWCSVAAGLQTGGDWEGGLVRGAPRQQRNVAVKAGGSLLQPTTSRRRAAALQPDIPPTQ